MKKILSLTLALLMVLGCLAAFASCAKKPTTVFKPEGESKGTLKLGFDAEYPPYGYLDTETNQYAGFDIELAKEVCKKMGYTLELIPIDWNAKDMALESGTINCIWSGFTINDRENDYAWTVPYANSAIVVLTKSDSNIEDLEDLAGKKVTVQLDSSGETALKEETDLVASLAGGKYLTCKDYTAAFTDLESGAVDAIVVDSGVAKDLITGKTGYTILEETLSSEQYGVGFAKTNTALRDAVQSAMLEIAADGTTVKTIAEKYGIANDICLGQPQ